MSRVKSSLKTRSESSDNNSITHISTLDFDLADAYSLDTQNDIHLRSKQTKSRNTINKSPKNSKKVILPLESVNKAFIDNDADRNTAIRKKISTFDALPHLDHYRDMFSLNRIRSRPSLRELHEGLNGYIPSRRLSTEILTKDIAQKEEERGISHGPKFGWIKGVLLRCILNIWGVMLFLRLSWIVGQAGIGYATLIVLLSVVVTCITSMSMSAICTNGEVKGGGAYYMISRSLGPEFGGAIGVIFSIASTVAVSMNVVGLAETVVDLISKHGSHLFNIISAENWIRIVGCITAVLLLCIVMAGMEWEAKAQIGFLILLLLAFLNYFLGTVLPIPQIKKSKGLLGYSRTLFKENFFSDFQKGASFFSIFAIYFPSATGILAGANISGDLKDAQQSIPKGTFAAIVLSAISYLFLIWTFGSVMLREASGNITDLYTFENNTRIPLTIAQLEAPNSALRRCGETQNCKYGLLYDYQAAEMISWFGPIITAGIFSATLSSALACLVGASKVFQALCRDKIFPYIDVLAVGTKKNDDPYRLYVLAFFIAVLFILLGDLNIIAPIISNFYLMAYALINYSCFDASISNSIGFRPGFKYFNPWVSLLGGFLCVLSMFLIKWWATLITFIFISLLYGYIRYKKPNINWGSSTQAHVYKNALNFLYKLNQTEEHIKNYKPQILALTGDPRNRPAFLDFANLLTKNLSLLICGHVILNPDESIKGINRDKIYDFLAQKHVKALYNPIIARDVKEGVRGLLQVSGLGRMRPNLLLMGYMNEWQSQEMSTVLEYFNIIHDAFDIRLSVGILRMPFGLFMCPIKHRPSISSPHLKRLSKNGDMTTKTTQSGFMRRRSKNYDLVSKTASVSPLPSPTSNTKCFDNDVFLDTDDSAQEKSYQTGEVRFSIDGKMHGKNSNLEIMTPPKKNFSESLPSITIDLSSDISHQHDINNNYEEDSGIATNKSHKDENEGIQSKISQSQEIATTIEATPNHPETSTPKSEEIEDHKTLRVSFDGTEFRLSPQKTMLQKICNISPKMAKKKVTQSKSLINFAKPNSNQNRTSIISLKDIKRRSRRLSHIIKYSFHHSNNPSEMYRIKGLQTYYNNYFRVRQKRGSLDIWWLFDDGGLTILLPYIISQRENWQNLKVRFYALSHDEKDVDIIHDNFASMLTKFRIDYTDVFIIPDIYKPPQEETVQRFEKIIEPYRCTNREDPNYKPGMITDAEYESMNEKSQRHIRLQELLQQHSQNANLIFITLPIPRKGTSAALYMSWLEIMTQNLPPTLMIRGNQESVLTFYS